MANATAKVGKGAIRWTDEFTKRSSATLSSATRFYTGAMVGTTTGGYLAKFDDTQNLTFAGLVRGKEGDPNLPAGTAGDGTIDLDLHQPKRFEIGIASIAVTDIGRLVYATFDQTGTFDPSATTYANVVGVLVDRVSSTIGIVEPLPALGYARPLGGALQVMAASAAVVVKPSTVIITKAGVAALTLVDPTTGVHDGLEMHFISSTAQAHTLSNAAGSGFNAGGSGTDVGTFGGAIGDNIWIVAYAGKWLVKAKTNVTLG